MARRHKHEEHANHEAWAIPYGDLITLLLAFFVVMYAMSSVNEGKYRVLSDSLVTAFQGAPRTLEPVQIGAKQVAKLEGDQHAIVALAPINVNQQAPPTDSAHDSEADRNDAAVRELDHVASEVEKAMASLIDQNLIAVRRHGLWVEVEIRTDILFPSGVATLAPEAGNVLKQLATTLQPFPNAIRVEGHTDNRPINTKAFRSNWELSSARAASVVHLFTENGMAPARLAVIGLAENRPSQGNDTPEGRNSNRRVVLVILSGNGSPEGDYAKSRGEEPAEVSSTETPTAPADSTVQSAPLAEPAVTAPLPTVAGR